MTKHNIELTHAEALVLFEWITRNDNAETFSFADEAEQRVIWKIEALLEKILVEPLSPEYEHLLAAARQDVRNG
jgi:hypothetical protein